MRNCVDRSVGVWGAGAPFGGAANALVSAANHAQGDPVLLHSTDRILSTHVGSLPRIEGLADLIVAQRSGGSVDPAEFQATLARATQAVVQKQLDAGIDIGNVVNDPATGTALPSWPTTEPPHV